MSVIRRSVLSGIFLSAFFAAFPAVYARELIFPGATAFNPGGFTGIAISNTGPESAVVSIALISADGVLAGAQGITNPQEVTLAAGQQFASLISDLFKVSPGDYWIRVQTTKQFVTGYCIFGAKPELLDGFGPAQVSTDQVLPSFQDGGDSRTQIRVVNPSPTAGASVRIEFLSAKGLVLGSQSAALQPQQQFAPDSSGIAEANSISHIRIVSDVPVAAAEAA